MAEEKRKTMKIPFMITPSESQALMSELNVSSLPELLPLLVPSAQLLSRTPISSFPVGAVGLGSSGRIYVGVNLEFPGLPLHHSVHAEQFLVTNALLHREPSLDLIAVSAAPCGHCRQFLQELRNSSQIRILVTSDGPGSDFRPLSDFLPRPFGPPDLLKEDVPLLLEAKVEEEEEEKEKRVNGFGSDMEGRLREAAVRVAGRAHAPYSGCRSGFAVADAEGRVYAGAYMESAAYNPSVGPAQAAAIAYVAGGGGGWDGIVGGVLVEAEGAAVEQEGTVTIFMEKVAPRAQFWVHRL
ncbi:putative cytidine deaminase 1 [Iris pallida]|uniref:cytidine deaminase n=1 Tax=Iris pallida TaxID=29817 RepID=A0AAX6HHZ5_IRIPA|nr:putative cytidine deaminase 1 [Iris pallida]